MRLDLIKTAALVGALCSTPVFAVTITEGVSNSGTDNVLFNQAGLTDNGTTVQGIVSGEIVNFISLTTLSTPSAGQARVEGDFVQLTISLDSGAGFDKIVFNLNVPNQNGGPARNVDINTDGNFQGNFAVVNGQNFFTVEADALEDIFSLELVLHGTTADDIRQVRIGLSEPVIQTPDGGSTLLLTGIGAFALGAIRARSRK